MGRKYLRFLPHSISDGAPLDPLDDLHGLHYPAELSVVYYRLCGLNSA